MELAAKHSETFSPLFNSQDKISQILLSKPGVRFPEKDEKFDAPVGGTLCPASPLI